MLSGVKHLGLLSCEFKRNPEILRSAQDDNYSIGCWITDLELISTHESAHSNHLITGPLGSGKTTLLRHILTAQPGKIAIVMNEFGEIAIDAKVIEGKNVRIAELGGGCVCCSLLGEFEVAVNEIIARSRLRASLSRRPGSPSLKRSCSTSRKHCRNAGSTAWFQSSTPTCSFVSRNLATQHVCKSKAQTSCC